MIKKIWNWGAKKEESAQDYEQEGGEDSAQQKPSTDDKTLEYLFNQLLEGVAKGWTENRIEKFFQNLEPKITVDNWLTWLQKYGESLVSSFAPHYTIASRMVILGEKTSSLPFYRPVGDLAHEFANEILARKDGIQLEPIQGNDSEDDSPEASSLADLLKLLQHDENFARKTARKLGLKNHEPGAIIEKLVKASNSSKEILLEMESITPEAQEEELVDVEWVEHWFGVGLEKAQKGDLQGAIASWDKIIEIEPNLEQVWHNRGCALAHGAKYAEAIESFDHALDINVNDVESWYSRGNALYNLQQYPEALMSWERAIGIQPNHFMAWYHKGLVLEILERYSEAQECYQQVRAIAPEFEEVKPRLEYLKQINV
ncbi:tetratricopeptide repeat protein [Cyanobacterium stanieri LEGE 03274]|uniref:Tetratricopeptide repeat protein n=1 Tax=Cyanobacterium stanieri LEGE 03274 TaxID=1828756 RepID=A0ABR9V3N3_9CHRO|nr:tetratricopeptide repeat protein [Cyanobacterium stanieri]MBE9222500.1 tetratricopeptide repeat protein [Cyanobacterium stanieri LEGE 03274]